jgi:hypothetical protein
VVDQDVGGLRLHGYTAHQAGEMLEVELHWQALTKPSVQLVRTVGTASDPSGAALGAEPLALLDYLPTDQWPQGQVVIDRVRLSLPISGPGSGPAALRVGWGPAGVAPETVDLTIDR